MRKLMPFKKWPERCCQPSRKVTTVGGIVIGSAVLGRQLSTWLPSAKYSAE
jgi:hypothetical protein